MSGATPSSGVLLHPTALPGGGPCGGFGAAARAWVDLLIEAGIGVWQVLPLAPTDGTGSPYSSPSGSALNPWLIDADDLLAADLIAAEDHATLPGADSPRLDPALASARSAAIATALGRHWSRQSPDTVQRFEQWRLQQRDWLEDHCHFMVLRTLQGGRPWWDWPGPLAQRQRWATMALIVNGARPALSFSGAYTPRRPAATRRKPVARSSEVVPVSNPPTASRA